MPDGSPRFKTVIRFPLLGFRYFSFISNKSVILRSLNTHSTAEITWAITVARATPATPMFSPATNHTSSIMLITVATRRYTKADKESPSPRSTPQRIL